MKLQVSLNLLLFQHGPHVPSKIPLCPKICVYIRSHVPGPNDLLPNIPSKFINFGRLTLGIFMPRSRGGTEIAQGISQEKIPSLG